MLYCTVETNELGKWPQSYWCEWTCIALLRRASVGTMSRVTFEQALIDGERTPRCQREALPSRRHFNGKESTSCGKQPEGGTGRLWCWSRWVVLVVSSGVYSVGEAGWFHAENRLKSGTLKIVFEWILSVWGENNPPSVHQGSQVNALTTGLCPFSMDHQRPTPLGLSLCHLHSPWDHRFQKAVLDVHHVLQKTSGTPREKLRKEDWNSQVWAFRSEHFRCLSRSCRETFSWSKFPFCVNVLCI